MATKKKALNNSAVKKSSMKKKVVKTRSESAVKTQTMRTRNKELFDMQRPELDFDAQTYRMLEELAKEAGYRLDKNQKSMAFRGIIAQLVFESFELDKDERNFSPFSQQRYLLAQKAKALRSKDYLDEDIMEELLKTPGTKKVLTIKSKKSKKMRTISIEELIEKYDDF